MRETPKQTGQSLNNTAEPVYLYKASNPVRASSPAAQNASDSRSEGLSETGLSAGSSDGPRQASGALHLALPRLAGKVVVANISGGKDSTALSLWLHECGIEHRRVFADTGWEHPATYDYLHHVLEPKLGPIDWVRGPRQMVDLIESRGMFPSRQRRFCTEELKVKPIGEYMLTLPGPRVTVLGIRASESQARAKLLEWDKGDEWCSDIWRPMIDWSEQDVIDTHRRNGVPPNPLYLLGASRVGCWPCINARKGELRVIADNDPERIEAIRALEKRVAVSAEARYERDRAKWTESPDAEPEQGTDAHERWAKKKKRLESPFRQPAFFQGKMVSADGDYPCWPIDEVMAWAHTSRGGRQFDMFGADDDAGCMRWGLCDGDTARADRGGR